MQNMGYNLLDTSKFDNFINERSVLLSEYNRINERFNSIVQNLSSNGQGRGANWQGQGADAFVQDAQLVRTNLGGIQDILHTMCDTLIDCREVFQECDVALGNANQSALQ